MSVVGENRSQLPLPPLDGNNLNFVLCPVEMLCENQKGSLSDSFVTQERLPVPFPFADNQTSLTDEVPGEDGSVPFGQPVQMSFSGYRFQLAAFLAAAIAAASFVGWPRKESAVAKKQEPAVQQQNVLVANQHNAVVRVLPISEELDIEAEDFGFVFETPVATPVALANDRQDTPIEVPVEPSVDFDLFAAELVKEPKNVFERDNSSEELDLAKDEPELIDDSALDPADFQTPHIPPPLSLPKHGTAISWMPTLNDAMQSAVESEKLVFLLQVSGNFALDEFT